MIKVNLLPQRKIKRVSEPGSRELFLGVGALAVAAAAVYFVVDRPRRTHLNEEKDAISALDQEIAGKNQKLVGYAEMKQAAADATARADSIKRLLSAKVVPGHVLQELGEVMATGHQPTMSEEMVKKTGNGPDADPNKKFATDWDPQHVWFTSFVDVKGGFRLEGGAQSQEDVTQLSKRLGASVYFQNVTPAGGDRVADRDTGLNYYRFTITGRVAY
jgi:Tfp pilus assembly protein PilN